MTIGTFYNPFADPQDRHPTSHCHKCGSEIYLEDDCYMHNALILCDRCGSEEYDIRTTGYELEQYYREMYGG